VTRPDPVDVGGPADVPWDGIATRPKAKRSGALAELPILIAVAVVVSVLLKFFIAQAFYIPSRSMVPQLQVDDRVVVSKLSYRLHTPRRGDIVVFDAPPSEQGAHARNRNPGIRAIRSVGEAIGVLQARTEFIKRVIGLPGETVEGRDGHVYVNGDYLYEPYLGHGVPTGSFGPVKVPRGQLWVMGDNRDESRDSRVFGPIRSAKVVGRAIWRIWPPGHLAFL